MLQAATPPRDSRRSSFTKVFERRSSKGAENGIPKLNNPNLLSPNAAPTPAKSYSSSTRRLSLNALVSPKASKSTDIRGQGGSPTSTTSSNSLSPPSSPSKSTRRFSAQGLRRSSFKPILEITYTCENCGRITAPKDIISCINPDVNSSQLEFGADPGVHSFCNFCATLYIESLVMTQPKNKPHYTNSPKTKYISTAPLCMKSPDKCRNHFPIMKFVELGNKQSKSSTFKIQMNKKYAAQCYLCRIEIEKGEAFLECDVGHHLFCIKCSTDYVMRWLISLKSKEDDDEDLDFHQLPCLGPLKICDGHFLPSQITSTVPKTIKGLYRQYKEHHESLFECGCCFKKTHKTDFVQCTEGHLFCKSCVSATVSSILFDQGKAGFELSDPRSAEDPFLAKWAVRCLETTYDCSGYFPLTQLREALSEDTFTTYESKSIEMALAEQPLVVCPMCKFFEVLDFGREPKQYTCKNPTCKKTTCTKCKKETLDRPNSTNLTHRCDLTLQDEFRLFVQNAKDKALIRICPSCKSPFYKTEGCNKMTCRCKVEMCYLCRTVITGTGYTHFCQHARDPAVGKCTTCTRCELYKWNDEDAVRSAGEEARVEFEKLHPGSTAKYELDKVVIG